MLYNDANQLWLMVQNKDYDRIISFAAEYSGNPMFDLTINDLDVVRWSEAEDKEIIRKTEKKKEEKQKKAGMAPVQPTKLKSTFHTKVVGVTFKNDDGSARQRIIRDLSRKGKLNIGQELRLIHEPTNPFDCNCIQVVTLDGRQIGCLSKEMAAKVATDMARGVLYKAYVSSVTGGDIGYAYGINIKVEVYECEQVQKASPDKRIEKGKELVEKKEYEKAFSVFMVLADEGHAEAQYQLGRLYDYGLGVNCDKYAATQWYKKAAEQGHSDAQYDLGYNYIEGEGTETDYAQGRYWIEKAKRQGNANADVMLGGIYEHGRGVPEDLGKAFEYYLQAAKAGVKEGQFNAGLFYLLGKGVKCDKAKAAEWISKAADQGHSNACFNLGLQLYHGDGIPVDIDRGIAYIAKAAALGHSKAIMFCQIFNIEYY